MTEKKLWRSAAALLALLLALLLQSCGALPGWQQVYQLFGLHTGSEMPQDALLEVAVLSVGQGDCILIRSEQFAALVDAGLADSYDAIAAALNGREIQTLNAVFITHPHADHMGALRKVLQNFSVKRVYFGAFPQEFTPTSTAFQKLMEEMEKQQIPLTVLQRGEQLALPLAPNDETPLCTLSVLWSGGGSSLNNCSLVLQLKLGQASALFMGDAEFEVEQQLLRAYGESLRADLLKVGHHGTRNACGSDFLAAVSPRFAAISCGVDNEYGYPKEETLSRLADCGAAVCRTDRSGDLVFWMNAEQLWQGETEEPA